MRPFTAGILAAGIFAMFAFWEVSQHGWVYHEGFSCPGCARKPVWFAFQQTLAAEGRVACKRGKLTVFLGDSITEAYRGTAIGQECQRCSGIPAVFSEELRGVNTQVLAISGDQTFHLQWRLRTDEALALACARTVFINIGTNDLSQLVAEEVGGWWNPQRGVSSATAYVYGDTLARRIDNVVGQVQALVPEKCKIVVQALLPRGPSFKPVNYTFPNEVYSDTLEHTNTRLKRALARRGSRVKFEESCGLVVVQGDKIAPFLMQDSLHPTAMGTTKILSCLRRTTEAW
eukprot:Rhum_TRINITY_DN14524_c6_g1::Rhum_TRINITY_DN14524_c6_g1_i1::g.96647::m.96647